MRTPLLEALEHFRTGADHRSKEDGSPVTAADEAVNALVIERVSELFPDDGIIGEEQSGGSGTSGRLWVCDPIDGTLPFTMGMPTNLFSLALVDDGEPVMGVLYDPYLDRLQEAVRGEGATVNGAPLRVSDQSLPGGILAIPDVQFGQLDTAALASHVLTGGSRILCLASITYVSSLVASGQVAGALFPGSTVWDIAAVKVIVDQAGGRVTDLDGDPQRYDRPLNGAIISNGTCHDALIDLVSRYRLGA